ncbi:MAG: hypothetical protein GY863_11935 [bacterium]|nr:hypothetical protein [bacterium]
MLKLGLLVQNNGSFGGNQVVPSEWIEESTRNQVPCREENEYGYGYFWWVPGQTDIAAIGYAGQYIYLYRDHNAIVIATTEANVLTGHASIQSNYIYGLLQDYIIPSFLENQN